MKPELPPAEHQRIDNLRGYSILDTPPEEVFNENTLLASRICETPIALISFLDSSREWIKSKAGTDLIEISRDVSCSPPL